MAILGYGFKGYKAENLNIRDSVILKEVEEINFLLRIAKPHSDA